MISWDSITQVDLKKKKKKRLAVPQKVNAELPHDLAIPFLGMYI